MATFPTLRHDGTGKTLYAVLNDASGQYWDTTGTPAFETFVVADWANYDTAASETPASSYQYQVTVPATLTSNAYVYITYYEQAGGSVAITDPVVATGVYWWDGATAREAPVDASGAGSIEFTYTVYQDDDTTPIEGVAVYVTSDLAGANIVAGTKRTDSSGEVVFYLDAGTYYLWRQHGGWNFTNPDTEVVA